MTAKGITAFYPTTEVVKLIKGKRKIVIESRLPNIFFAYGTEEQLKTFVYDNVNLPFLRFTIVTSTKAHESPNDHLLSPNTKSKVLNHLRIRSRGHHPRTFRRREI